MHVLLSEHRNIHSIGFAIVTESMDGAGGWGQAYLLATTNYEQKRKANKALPIKKV